MTGASVIQQKHVMNILYILCHESKNSVTSCLFFYRTHPFQSDSTVNDIWFHNCDNGHNFFFISTF